MTPRMAFGLAKVIVKAVEIEYYRQIMSYNIDYSKFPSSLEEYLALSLNKEAPKPFDEKTDKILEELALKRFMEGNKNGK